MKFYFTYGSGEWTGMPFVGGWTEVEAENEDEAVTKFKAAHPNPDDENILNCCAFYNEDLFNRTGMRETGNHGAFCQEVL